MRLLRSPLSMLLALLGFFCGSQPASSANWPRFRGPNGAGAASGQEIPVRWDDHSVLWKVEIPGAGNSSPIVWGDRVFLQTASTDGKDRALLCLAVKDGKPLWSASVP